jgi:hypothetical protein
MARHRRHALRREPHPHRSRHRRQLTRRREIRNPRRRRRARSRRRTRCRHSLTAVPRRLLQLRHPPARVVQERPQGPHDHRRVVALPFLGVLRDRGPQIPRNPHVHPYRRHAPDCTDNRGVCTAACLYVCTADGVREGWSLRSRGTPSAREGVAGAPAFPSRWPAPCPPRRSSVGMLSCARDAAWLLGSRGTARYLHAPLCVCSACV